MKKLRYDGDENNQKIAAEETKALFADASKVGNGLSRADFSSTSVPEQKELDPSKIDFCRMSSIKGLFNKIFKR